MKFFLELLFILSCASLPITFLLSFSYKDGEVLFQLSVSLLFLSFLLRNFYNQRKNNTKQKG